MVEKNIDDSAEMREVRSGRREIIIHFFRHGEQAGSSPDSGITEEAASAAFQVGRGLVGKIGQGEWVRFATSKQERAKQTLENIQEGFEQEVESSGRKDIKTYSEGTKKRGDIGVFWIDQEYAWFREFLRAEDKINHWLTSPSKAAESVGSVVERFKRFIRIREKMAGRLPPGPKIHIMAVTHSGPMRAELENEFGPGVGSDLGNCESFEVAIHSQSEKPPTLNFRGKTKEINTEKKLE